VQGRDLISMRNKYVNVSVLCSDEVLLNNISCVLLGKLPMLHLHYFRQIERRDECDVYQYEKWDIYSTLGKREKEKLCGHKMQNSQIGNRHE